MKFTSLAILAALLPTAFVPSGTLHAEGEKPAERVQYPKPETKLEDPLTEKNRNNFELEQMKKGLRGSGFSGKLPPDFRKVFALLYMQDYASPALDLLKEAIGNKDIPRIREATENLHSLYSKLQKPPLSNEAKWVTISQQGKQAAVTIRSLTYRDDGQKLIDENFAKVVQSCYACHRAYGGPAEKYEELVRFKHQKDEPLKPVPDLPNPAKTKHP